MNNSATPKQFPLTTISLIGLIILIWFLMSSGHLESFELDTLISWGGSSRELVQEQHQYWRLVSCMFLHVGLVHLAMNMVALFDIGGLIEGRLGSLRVLVIFVVSGIAGAVLSLLWTPNVLSVGASGGVLGLAGAAIVTFWGDGTHSADETKKIVRSLLMVVALTFGYGLVSSGIDNAAHFGGLIAGLAGGLVCRFVLPKPAARPGTAKRVLVLGLTAGIGLSILVNAYGIPSKGLGFSLFADENLSIKHQAQIAAAKILANDFADGFAMMNSAHERLSVELENARLEKEDPERKELLAMNEAITYVVKESEVYQRVDKSLAMLTDRNLQFELEAALPYDYLVQTNGPDRDKKLNSAHLIAKYGLRITLTAEQMREGHEFQHSSDYVSSLQMDSREMNKTVAGWTNGPDDELKAAAEGLTTLDAKLNERIGEISEDYFGYVGSRRFLFDIARW